MDQLLFFGAALARFDRMSTEEFPVVSSKAARPEGIGNLGMRL